MPDDATTSELPTVPIIGALRPWINLIHIVGVPWIIIGLTAYYGIPFTKSILEEARCIKEAQLKLDAKAEKAMPMLEELQGIHEGIQRGAIERRQDLERLQKATVSIGADVKEAEGLKNSSGSN